MKRRAKPCDLRIPLLAKTVPQPRDYSAEFATKRLMLRTGVGIKGPNDKVVGPAPTEPLVVPAHFRGVIKFPTELHLPRVVNITSL